MFDPVTIDLIKGAPPLGGLDFSELPQRFTNAFAEIVAARVRLRGVATLEQRGETVIELLAEMRRLAAAQELLVATVPERADRASAAFVAGTAHQLCLMAETVAADGALRFSTINATHVDHDICATLLFLIADSQSDAAEMAKRIKRPDGDLSAEGRLVTAIRDLATGRLRDVIASEVDEANLEFYDPPSDTSESGIAVEALLRRLHTGVTRLARELLTSTFEGASSDAIPESRKIFAHVRDLAVAPITAVFEDEGPEVFSVFPGPLHIAKLLLAVSDDLAEAALCRVPAPNGVNSGAWSRVVRRAAQKRPYLWRNHREALKKGYLENGVSAAVSFPTGGGKSTLAELKIAAALLGGGQVVVLAPTLALVDQTAFTLGNAFKDYTVFGDLDDEITFSDVLELPEIIVTTPERCLALQSIQPEAFAQVALVVFDECHLLHPRESDRSRRAIDAMLCVLSLNSCAPDADLLLVSAMMQNAEEIAGWVAELTGRPCLPLDLAWKPTRQARGCVAYEAARITALNELLAVEQLTATTKGVPKPLAKQLSAPPFAFFCLRQTWATRNREDYALMALLDEAVPFATGKSERSGEWYMTPNGNVVAGTIAAAASEDGLKTLTFVQSTTAAESTVRHFRSLLPKRRVALTEEEQVWRKLVEEEMGGPQHCYLKLDATGQVDGGATSHHGQLLKPERMLHESLFKRRDGVDALFATSTLAQGMNLPSDIVLIAGDSRWDVSDDKFKQLDAHELLNAAGRAGRAGEGGQGFVLVVPSKIINIDEDDNTIHRHWMSLQSIFSQSDQCLKIEDPITGLLDRIHLHAHEGNEDYFLTRLPVGEGDEPDEPAKELIRRSFAAYRKREEGKADWIESRIDAALARRNELAPKQDVTWLERVAASAGLPYEVAASLSALIEAGAFDRDSTGCIDTLFDWIETNPSWLMHLIRPNDIEGLFGKDYRAIDSNAGKAKVALPQIRPLLTAWMAGKPLCELERAIGTKEHLIKTCETARHFVVRLVPDLAFVAGLPARILAAKAFATGDEPAITIVLQTLSGVVRKGCASPEQLANAVLLQSESRPSAWAKFSLIEHHIPAGANFETFDQVLDRVRFAHDVAAFDNL